MAPIMEVAEAQGLYVIEDAAQAHGAKYKGRKVGSIGDVACFSFYADKLMTTVEGGIAITNNPEFAEKMRILRNLGSDKQRKFRHPLLGFNYKMSDIHAAIGVVQLKKLDKYIMKRRENVAYLKERLKDLDLKFPTEEDYAFNVYYMYYVLANKEKEKIVQYLEREGIETRPLFSFIPEQIPYQHLYDVNEYQVAKDAHQKGFYVSNSPSLSMKQLDFMASALTKAVSGC
jgi:perosamine synthetase